MQHTENDAIELCTGGKLTFQKKQGTYVSFFLSHTDLIGYLDRRTWCLTVSPLHEGEANCKQKQVQDIEVCIKQYTKNSRYLHDYRRALLYVYECKMCLLHV